MDVTCNTARWISINRGHHHINFEGCESNGTKLLSKNCLICLCYEYLDPLLTSKTKGVRHSSRATMRFEGCGSNVSQVIEWELIHIQCHYDSELLIPKK